MGIPPRHLPEFRRKVVELYQSGRSLGVADEGVWSAAVADSTWARQSEREKADVNYGLSQAERQELGRVTSHRLRLGTDSL